MPGGLLSGPRRLKRCYWGRKRGSKADFRPKKACFPQNYSGLAWSDPGVRGGGEGAGRLCSWYALERGVRFCWNRCTEVMVMTQTVTAVYANLDAGRNALEDLVADGFDREKVFLDEENLQVKVMVPDSVQANAEEILRRHDPKDIWSRPVQ